MPRGARERRAVDRLPLCALRRRGTRRRCYSARRTQPNCRWAIDTRCCCGGRAVHCVSRLPVRIPQFLVRQCSPVDLIRCWNRARAPSTLLYCFEFRCRACTALDSTHVLKPIIRLRSVKFRGFRQNVTIQHPCLHILFVLFFLRWLFYKISLEIHLFF